MKPILTLFLLVTTGMLGCKPKGPLVEPQDNPGLATAPPTSATTAAQPTR